MSSIVLFMSLFLVAFSRTHAFHSNRFQKHLALVQNPIEISHAREVRNFELRGVIDIVGRIASTLSDMAAIFTVYPGSFLALQRLSRKLPTATHSFLVPENYICRSELEGERNVVGL